MNTKFVRGFQFTGVALLAGSIGLVAPRIVDRVSGEGRTNIGNLTRYRIDAGPYLVVEILKTEPEKLLLTIHMSDESQVGIVCDAKHATEIYRTYSDERNVYMRIDKNADGIPELQSTKDRRTRISIIERIKSIEWEK